MSTQSRDSLVNRSQHSTKFSDGTEYAVIHHGSKVREYGHEKIRTQGGLTFVRTTPRRHESKSNSVI